MTPPPINTAHPADSDAQSLKTIAILHFVLGGLGIIGLAFLALQFFLLWITVANPGNWNTPEGGKPADPDLFYDFIFWIYLAGAVFILLCMLANFFSGLALLKRRRRTFSLVTAYLNLLQFPLGTALGVFTIIVLMRDSVRLKYASSPAPAIHPS